MKDAFDIPHTTDPFANLGTYESTFVAGPCGITATHKPHGKTRPDGSSFSCDGKMITVTSVFSDPGDDRTPEAIAQDDRQAADFGGHEPTYHAALVVIANEEGAGRYARAINLVAKIWGKTENEVLTDAVML